MPAIGRIRPSSTIDSCRPTADGRVSPLTASPITVPASRGIILRYIWWTILLAGLISACGKPTPGEPIAGKTVEWRDLALPGKTLALMHPTKLRIFPFKDDFTAVATIGNDGANGAVAGPILFWGIRGDALVISISPVLETVEHYAQQDSAETDVIAILTAPTLDGDVLTVLSKSGERESYRLTQRV
jgi:hypothetical protein